MTLVMPLDVVVRRIQVGVVARIVAFGCLLAVAA
jgi:hypothetical protein